MKFVKKSIWSFSAVIARALGALAINKVFALYFGTSGITLLAHFQNLIALFTQIPNDGINRSIIRTWANPDAEDHYKQDILSSGILLTALTFTFVMAFVFLENEVFIEPFIEYISEGVFLIIVIFSMIAILANLLAQSLIMAHNKIKAYSILSMMSVGVLIIFILWAVNYQLLEIAFIAYALGNSVSLIFSLIYLNRGMHIKITLTEPTRESLKEIFQFVGMALSVLIFGKLLDFFIRSAAIDWFGMEITGYWQSLVKLSDSYVMVFIGTVGVVFFPQVSALVNKKDRLFQYLNQVLLVVIPSLAVLLLILYMIGEPVLGLLFTDDFFPAYSYMHYQLIGDFIMLTAYLFAYILMAQKSTIAYILLQVVSAMVYLSVIFIFKNTMGVEAIMIGHIARNVVFLTILVILVRKYK